jgi:hypothetical protein
MPAKGVNTKKESGRAKKAENEEKKKQATAATKVWDMTPFISSRRDEIILFAGKVRRGKVEARS